MRVVIRKWVWLETIGVVSGCFPHITSLLHLYLFFFAAASLLLFSFFVYTLSLWIRFFSLSLMCTRQELVAWE